VRSAVTPGLGDDPTRVIGARTFDFSRQVAVMAIVNRTRDSFYDNGSTFDWRLAVRAVERAVADGADWVDIGGVPFSPGAQPVSLAQELDRVVPLVHRARQTGDVVLSVDTRRSEVAREALRAGADVINDTSGLADPRMAEVIAAGGGTLIVCHSRSGWPADRSAEVTRPTYRDVVAEVRELLIDRAGQAVRLGVPAGRIVVDPGHDLHKNTLHSLELTRRLDEFTDLGYPVLAAVSNKDFIQESLGLATDQVLAGTTAAHVICVLQGARVLRVHDVPAAVSAARLTGAVLGWHPPAHLRHNV
jgi:dihydropteroate synthase